MIAIASLIGGGHDVRAQDCRQRFGASPGVQLKQTGRPSTAHMEFLDGIECLLATRFPLFLSSEYIESADMAVAEDDLIALAPERIVASRASQAHPSSSMGGKQTAERHTRRATRSMRNGRARGDRNADSRLGGATQKCYPINIIEGGG
jgi:hypothetical protein